MGNLMIGVLVLTGTNLKQKHTCIFTTKPFSSYNFLTHLNTEIHITKQIAKLHQRFYRIYSFPKAYIYAKYYL